MARVDRMIGGITSFMARSDGLAAPIAAGLQVTEDVLHAHDGVVHQQAQGEDQGEERDPVDGEARGGS